jgi:hypothetical protein
MLECPSCRELFKQAIQNQSKTKENSHRMGGLTGSNSQQETIQPDKPKSAFNLRHQTEVNPESREETELKNYTSECKIREAPGGHGAGAGGYLKCQPIFPSMTATISHSLDDTSHDSDRYP